MTQLDCHSLGFMPNAFPPSNGSDSLEPQRVEPIIRVEDLLHPELRKAIENVRAKLRPGGPPVDTQALRLCLENKLESTEEDKVLRAVYSWTSWFHAYWEMQIQLDGMPADIEEEL